MTGESATARSNHGRWVALLALVFGGSGLLVAMLLGSSAGATVQGNVQGRAATLEYVAGESFNGLNGLGFPPGGTLKKPLAANELGGALSMISTSAQTDCNGNATGTQSVNAHCSADARGVVIAVNGKTILTADSIHAEARASGIGDGADASAEGTAIIGLCVQSVAGQPCVAVEDVADGSAKIDADGVVGTVTLHHIEGRSQTSGVPGSGIYAVAMELELNISGHGTVIFRIGVADAFVGTVRTCGTPTYATPTETPTKTPTPALQAEATPTCAPTATSTPRLGKYGASAPGVAKD